MPERQRRAILLREWQGLSYREIAAELELSQSAVEMLIFRARRALANGLRGVPAPSKRRAALGLNLSSLLEPFKSLLGGAAAKVAVGAVVVAATASVGALELTAERPARLPSPPPKTIPRASSSPQEVFDSARPLAPHPGGRTQEGAQVGSPDHAAGSSGTDTDHSAAQLTHTSGGPGQVASILTGPGTGLAGAPSLADAVVPVIEQVAPAVLPVTVEAPPAALQAGEQVLAPLPVPPVVSLP